MRVDALIRRFPPHTVLITNWLDRIGEVDFTITEGPNSEIIREAEGGGFEQFDGLTWVPWEPPASVAAKGFTTRDHSDVHLTPMTSLDESVASGDIEMQLVPLNEIWEEELGDRVEAWFKEGDVIIFNPGGPNQEARKIVSLIPLRLDWPLDFQHSPATMVAVLPENLYEPSDRQETVEVTQIIHNENDETLKFAIRIPYMAIGNLEFSTDMTTWQPLTPLALPESVSTMAPFSDTSRICSGVESESPAADEQEDGVIPPNPSVADPPPTVLIKSLLFRGMRTVIFWGWYQSD